MIDESARVLIIDDEKIISLTMQRLLIRHAVDTAASGEEAIHLLSGATGYDIIFCDLMMPDVSGMQVYEHVENTAPTLAERFVFMTGGAFTAEASAFLRRVGDDRVMYKPLAFGEVRARVEHARSERA